MFLLFLLLVLFLLFLLPLLFLPLLLLLFLLLFLLLLFLLLLLLLFLLLLLLLLLLLPLLLLLLLDLHLKILDTNFLNLYNHLKNLNYKIHLLNYHLGMDMNQHPHHQNKNQQVLNLTLTHLKYQKMVKNLLYLRQILVEYKQAQYLNMC